MFVKVVTVAGRALYQRAGGVCQVLPGDRGDTVYCEGGLHFALPPGHGEALVRLLCAYGGEQPSGPVDLAEFMGAEKAEAGRSVEPFDFAAFKRLFADAVIGPGCTPDATGDKTSPTGLYERFTDRARKVMSLANQEARQLGHEYLGTEHILLGLVKEGSGVAGNVLRSMGVSLDKVRGDVVALLVQLPPEKAELIRSGTGKVPQTPRARKVVEWAPVEAKALGHNYVGTEHLLLALLSEVEGVASRVLKNLGLTAGAVRQEVRDMLGIKAPTGDGITDDTAAVKALVGSGFTFGAVTKAGVQAMMAALYERDAVGVGAVEVPPQAFVKTPDGGLELADLPPPLNPVGFEFPLKDKAAVIGYPDPIKSRRRHPFKHDGAGSVPSNASENERLKLLAAELLGKKRESAEEAEPPTTETQDSVSEDGSWRDKPSLL